MIGVIRRGWALRTALLMLVGVEFDPDDWLERLRGGESERDLLKIDTEGEVSPIRGALQSMIA